MKERTVAVVNNKEQERGIQRWFRETRSELRKVVWPTREEALRLMYVVLGISLAMGLLLGFVDFALSALYSALVG
jgi:preprotein translocase subunit SecE